MNVLHIDSGILGDHSVSRRLTAAIAAQIKAENPDAQITYRDVVADALPHLTGAHLMAANAKPEDVDATVADDVATSAAVLEEFLAADTVIVGAPMYNFSLPSQLKAWIDRVAVAVPAQQHRGAEQDPAQHDREHVEIDQRSPSSRAPTRGARRTFHRPMNCRRELPREDTSATSGSALPKRAIGAIGSRQLRP